MVASQAVMQHGADARVSKMLVEMEAHAASGEWEKVEELTLKLKNAILAVPDSEQRETLLAARRSMEQVQSIAQDAKNDVSDKLSSIRRGKDAAKAYAAAD